MTGVAEWESSSLPTRNWSQPSLWTWLECKEALGPVHLLSPETAKSSPGLNPGAGRHELCASPSPESRLLLHWFRSWSEWHLAGRMEGGKCPCRPHYYRGRSGALGRVPRVQEPSRRPRHNGRNCVKYQLVRTRWYSRWSQELKRVGAAAVVAGDEDAAAAAAVARHKGESDA